MASPPDVPVIEVDPPAEPAVVAPLNVSPPRRLGVDDPDFDRLSAASEVSSQLSVTDDEADLSSVSSITSEFHVPEKKVRKRVHWLDQDTYCDVSTLLPVPSDSESDEESTAEKEPRRRPEPVRLPPYCSSDPDIPVKLRLDPTADTYHHEKPQTIIDMFKKAVNNYKDETALAMKLVVEPDEEKDDKKEAEEKDKKKEAKEEEEDEGQTERLSPESARIREKMEKERRQKQKEKEKRKRKRSLRGQHQWKTWTFEEYYDACITAAKAFIECGLLPCYSVCMLGYNAPEWHISNIAAIMAGGLSAGINRTYSSDLCFQIAEDCRANIIVVENDVQLQKILLIRSKLTHLTTIVHYGNFIGPLKEGVLRWEDLMELGKSADCDETFTQRMSVLKPNACCTLIYPPSSSGRPRGVMLSHDNITWTTKCFLAQVKIIHRMIATERKISYETQETVIGYLPLSHILPQLLDIYVTIVSGGSCWFSQPNPEKESLMRTMKDVRPTIFLAIPELWEKISQTFSVITDELKKSGFKKALGEWMEDMADHENLRHDITSDTALSDEITSTIFYNKIRRTLGLDRCHFAVTGATRLPLSLYGKGFFITKDMALREIFGMSETTGLITISTNLDYAYDAHTKGIAPLGTKLFIANPDSLGTGEIVVKGRNIFMGYLWDPQATADAFDPKGCFVTGDIGNTNTGQSLYLAGRTSDMIVTKEGYKVAPEPIERKFLKDYPAIYSHAIVIGNNRDYLTLLFSLKMAHDDSEEFHKDVLMLLGFLGIASRTFEQILSRSYDKETFFAIIDTKISRINKDAPCEAFHIRKWAMMARDLSVELGELTSTGRMNRDVIEKNKAALIKRLYH